MRGRPERSSPPRARCGRRIALGPVDTDRLALASSSWPRGDGNRLPGVNALVAEPVQADDRRLGRLLGDGGTARTWNPQDGRIVRLGLHQLCTSAAATRRKCRRTQIPSRQRQANGGGRMPRRLTRAQVQAALRRAQADFAGAYADRNAADHRSLAEAAASGGSPPGPACTPTPLRRPPGRRTAGPARRCTREAGRRSPPPRSGTGCRRARAMTCAPRAAR